LLGGRAYRSCRFFQYKDKTRRYTFIGDRRTKTLPANSTRENISLRARRRNDVVSTSFPADDSSVGYERARPCQNVDEAITPRRLKSPIM